MFTPEDVTEDAFLGGALWLWQPRHGYRAATDPVLLAACTDARAGQSVLDLGCGVGAAALCLATRVPGLALTGLEVQAAYADLARRNAARAGIALQVVEGSVLDMPKLLHRGFDHVITNPPYYPPDGTKPRDAGRDVALHEQVSLADWIGAALRRVAPGGWLTMILRADGLDRAFAGLGPAMGSATVLPIAAREGRPAGRVVIRARKGGRGGLRLLAPVILHDGPQHSGDGCDQSAAATAVFRQGGTLCHLFN